MIIKIGKFKIGVIGKKKKIRAQQNQDRKVREEALKVIEKKHDYRTF